MSASRTLMLVVVVLQLMPTYTCLAQAEDVEPEIAFYLVEIGSEKVRNHKKGNGTYSQWVASTVGQTYLLENYEILGDPFLTDDDIEYYCWADHTIFLNARGVERWNQVGGVHVPLLGIPFLVVVAGEPCYGAMVWNPVSSAMSRLPQFWSFAVNGRLITGCCSRKSDEEPPPDVRSNARIKEALRSAGKLVEVCSKR
jgi:hypothetical protein